MPKQSHKIFEEGWTYIKYVIDIARESFLILDKDLKIISANETFYRTFLVNKKETEGQLIYNLGNKQWDNKKLKELLHDILPNKIFFRDFEIEHKFESIGKKVMLLNARMLFSNKEDSKEPVIILAIEDVTKERLLKEKLKTYSEELEEKVIARTSELEKRIGEIEKMNKFMVGREIKMSNLKDEIAILKNQLIELHKKVNGFK